MPIVTRVHHCCCIKVHQIVKVRPQLEASRHCEQMCIPRVSFVKMNEKQAPQSTRTQRPDFWAQQVGLEHQVKAKCLAVCVVGIPNTQFGIAKFCYFSVLLEVVHNSAAVVFTRLKHQEAWLDKLARLATDAVVHTKLDCLVD